MAAAGLLLFATGAGAQSVMDGTESAIAPTDIAILREAMVARLFDPYGAQLRKLKALGPSRVCGQINGRNKAGGLTGFKSFGLDVEQKTLYIEPSPNIEGLSVEELKEMLADLQGVLRACEPLKVPAP